MLDEPSLGLAPMLVHEIFEIIGQINRQEGMSVLIVEQNARAALELADYAYVMENGRIVLDGPAAQMRENEDIKEFYLGAEPSGRAKELPRGQALQAAEALAGIRSNPHPRPPPRDIRERERRRSLRTA